MSSIPKGIFIQQSDDGTDVFFLTLVGIASNTSLTEHEWEVEKQHHISKAHILNLLSTVQTLLPKESTVDFDKESVWFVQYKNIEEEA